MVPEARGVVDAALEGDPLLPAHPGVVLPDLLTCEASFSCSFSCWTLGQRCCGHTVIVRLICVVTIHAVVIVTAFRIVVVGRVFAVDVILLRVVVLALFVHVTPGGHGGCQN